MGRVATSISIFLCALSTWVGTAAAAEPAGVHHLSLYIDDVPIDGSNEKWARLAQLPEAIRWEHARANLLTPLGRESFRLKLVVTEPDGGSVDYTGSRRVRYRSFGCIDVQEDGVVFIRRSDSCRPGEPSEIWISVMGEDDSTPLAANQYGFVMSGDEGTDERGKADANGYAGPSIGARADDAAPRHAEPDEQR